MNNTLFPGRPKYEGPTEGVFGLLHHEVLAELSHDVMERAAYVQSHKPKTEVAIRLHNMIYLGGCPAVAKRARLNADYDAKFATLNAEYRAKFARLAAEYRAKFARLAAKYRAKFARLNAGHRAKFATLNAEHRAEFATLNAEHRAKRATLNAEHWAKFATLNTAYRAKRATLDAELLAYIKTHIPDCAWNGSTLVFPEAQ